MKIRLRKLLLATVKKPVAAVNSFDDGSNLSSSSSSCGKCNYELSDVSSSSKDFRLKEPIGKRRRLNSDALKSVDEYDEKDHDRSRVSDEEQHRSRNSKWEKHERFGTGRRSKSGRSMLSYESHSDFHERSSFGKRYGCRDGMYESQAWDSFVEEKSKRPHGLDREGHRDWIRENDEIKWTKMNSYRKKSSILSYGHSDSYSTLRAIIPDHLTSANVERGDIYRQYIAPRSNQSKLIETMTSEYMKQPHSIAAQIEDNTFGGGEIFASDLSEFSDTVEDFLNQNEVSRIFHSKNNKL